MQDFIFVNNSRGASRTIKNYLNLDITSNKTGKIDNTFIHFGGHRPYNDIINYLKEKNLYKNNIKFIGCVRNPWAQIVSLFFYYLEPNNDGFNSKKILKMLKKNELLNRFDNFFKNKILKTWEKMVNIDKFFNITENSICLDYVIKFENLEPELNKIITKIGINKEYKKFKFCYTRNHNKEIVINNEKKIPFVNEEIYRKIFDHFPEYKVIIENMNKNTIKMFNYKY